MEQVFKFIVDSRKTFIELVDGLSIGALNEVPEGFNNNIIWNFGHIVVSTSLLCYVRTGIRPEATFIKYLDAYKKGTKPSYTVTPSEVEDLKALALSTIGTLEEDYKRGLFTRIDSVETVTFGITIGSFEQLLVMTAGHDNVHYGYAMAQRRIINNQ